MVSTKGKSASDIKKALKEAEEQLESATFRQELIDK